MKRIGKKPLLYSCIVTAITLAIMGAIFYKLAIDTDMRVVRWFQEGVNINRIASESPKEQQYGVAGLVSWVFSFIFVIISCIQWFKHSRK